MLLHGNERKSRTISHRLYAGTEQAGFASVSLFGDLEGGALRPERPVVGGCGREIDNDYHSFHPSSFAPTSLRLQLGKILPHIVLEP